MIRVVMIYLLSLLQKVVRAEFREQDAQVSLFFVEMYRINHKQIMHGNCKFRSSAERRPKKLWQKALLFTFFIGLLESAVLATSIPLGVVSSAERDEVLVEVDPDIQVPLGSIVGIYGLGSLERHPLTKKIILMGAEEVAKGQVLSNENGLLIARIIWTKKDVKVGPGMDVVLLPGESSSNSAPIISGEITEKIAPIQHTQHLDIPIADPDGDFVFYDWKLEGKTGWIGFLDARETYLPKIVWFTPGVETKANLVVTATDSQNHTTTLKVPLRTMVPSNPFEHRVLKPIGEFGLKVELPLRTLTRDNDGQWWGSNRDSLVMISPGWRQIKSLYLANDIALFKPIEVVTFLRNVHVLDGSSRTIVVLRFDGTRLRNYGNFSAPTDMTIDPEGTIYVADQVAGGILVYNMNGELVEKLGSIDDRQEGFVGLSRLALGSNRELVALDSETKLIHRFDAQHNRLTTWPLPLQGKEFPVDLACHPDGHVLVLLGNGRIMTLIKDGQFGMSIEPVSGSYSIDRLERPDSIFVAPSGEMYVTYAKSGLLARYSTRGSLTGLRGPSLWEINQFAADGAGNIYGLNNHDKHIYCFDHEGWLVKQIGGLGLNQSLLEKPVELAAPPDGSALVVLDTHRKKILKFQVSDPTNPATFSFPDSDIRQIHKHMNLVMDEVGRTYILDSKFRRVLVFNAEGRLLLQFGRNNQKGFTKELQKPSLLAVNPNGKFIFIYDKYQIKKFEIDHRAGAAVHVANLGSKGKGVAQFQKPVAMAADRSGLLYVLDVGRQDIQVMSITGKEMKEVYTRKYADWGMKRVDDMVVDADGHIYLGRLGTLFAVGW